ncbi:MbnP family protein [Xanthomarina sp. GH4-25]|uniref:MbnP family protein n=1 Tax=Xanthomarina sp. GH4-25 TaxID=3349335 RepID=UPI0038782960
MKKIMTFVVFCLVIISCKNDDDEIICCQQPIVTDVTFTFSHNWDDNDVNSSDFNTTQYTNANGEILTISKIRYLLSHFELVNTNGNSFPLTGYNLIDLSNPDSFTFNTTIADGIVYPGLYTLKFNYGFNEEDNIDGAYPDLNSASWNWPTMLGGGYHFLQFDGMFNVNTTAPSPFNYHNGTAKISDGVFEQNFVSFEFFPEIVIEPNTSIEIKMDLSEFFKNPIVWDLNTYNTSLMPNYDAQKMMQQNVGSVFSIGQITQE